MDEKVLKANEAKKLKSEYEAKMAIAAAAEKERAQLRATRKNTKELKVTGEDCRDRTTL